MSYAPFFARYEKFLGPIVKIALRKTSLVDFPGCISSAFFFSGCNLRCPWCHNRELVLGTEENLISPEDAFAHLKKRQIVLKGVVLSGGEPCLCGELPEIIREIKKLSLKVKLDTNGTLCAMLEKLFNSTETRPDYIALDLKLAPARYKDLAGNKDFSDELIRSAELIRLSGIEHEYRTLALPGEFITVEDIEALAPLTDNSPWYVRPFRGGNCLDPAWNEPEAPQTAAKAAAEELAAKARELGKNGIAV